MFCCKERRNERKKTTWWPNGFCFDVKILEFLAEVTKSQHTVNCFAVYDYSTITASWSWYSKHSTLQQLISKQSPISINPTNSIYANIFYNKSSLNMQNTRNINKKSTKLPIFQLPEANTNNAAHNIPNINTIHSLPINQNKIKIRNIA